MKLSTIATFNPCLLVIFFVTSALVLDLTPSAATKQSSDQDYRQEMRDFVQGISTYTKDFTGNFIVIPQNGHALLTDNGEPTGTPPTTYLAAIDGVGREDLRYGYDDDNVATPKSVRDEMVVFMDLAENHGVEVLVTDYCWTQSLVDDSYSQHAAKGYISFAADHRELDTIPAYPVTPFTINSRNITSLDQASNFLYLLNPVFSSQSAFLDSLQATNYDVLILDLFFEDQELSSAEIDALKTKANGGSRLVIAYMSIGEAEDYRFYWHPEWETISPSWLAAENPDWEGNYKVRYWDSNWQTLIYNNSDSYAKKIVDAGFDGVYLDIIDAFEYFEDNKGGSTEDSSTPGFTMVMSLGVLILAIFAFKKRKK